MIARSTLAARTCCWAAVPGIRRVRAARRGSTAGMRPLRSATQSPTAGRSATPGPARWRRRPVTWVSSSPWAVATRSPPRWAASTRPGRWPLSVHGANRSAQAPSHPSSSRSMTPAWAADRRPAPELPAERGPGLDWRRGARSGFGRRSGHSACEREEDRGGRRMTAAMIIEAIGSLLWPLLVAVVLIRVLPHVPGVVADLRRALRTRAFRVKVGGAELTVEEATEQLRRQVTDLQNHMAAQLAAQAAQGGTRPPTPAGIDLGAAPAAEQARPTVLWVDDDPDDNTLELAKLREDGIEVLLARSTAEALDVLSLRRGVGAIVTDLGRSEDGEFRSHAGLALLRQLGEAEHDQPVLVYTSTRRVELDRQDALDAGATVVTSSPTELFAALRRVLSTPTPDPEPGHTPAAPGRSARRPSRPG